MPTTTVKTIGSGARDYSTLQAWEDAAPANLVTSDVVWQGQCYNDSEFFSIGGVGFLDITGSTSDATRYKELTVATGQSFQDNANVRTNLLQYNQSNGVGIRGVLLSDTPIKMREDFCRINRIQLLLNEGNYGALLVAGASSNGCVVSDCIFDALKPATGGGVLSFDATSTSSTTQFRNLVVYVRGAAALPTHVGISHLGRGTAVGCTFVRTSSNTADGTGILGGYDSCAIVDCAIFGFATPAPTQGAWVTTNCKNNATDQSSGLPGSGQQYSVTYNSSSPFVLSSAVGTSGTYDLRAVAATALASNGTLVSTASLDISLTSRAASPTIGAWELTGGAVSSTDPPFFAFTQVPLHYRPYTVNQ